MIECNCMIPVMNYGSSASYKAEPSPEQIATGVIPLDSLPAAWWNCMWSQTNTAVNQARQELGQLIVELNNVLCNAGVCPQDVCTDQLYQSIEKIRQTLGNATTAGAVKSSSQPSEVAIDQTTGMMSVNCLGNAASLTTSARTVVGAVNELKSTYDQCFTDTGTALAGKAPTSHASDATTYGVGNADCYGHLKISDTYTCDLGCTGMAASQSALYCVYDCLATIAAGVASLGNTAGCDLGTAAAGTAVTAARSDHVHPIPSLTCLAAYTASADRGVVLTCAITAAGCCQSIGPATVCKFTFNPATGVVKALCFCGNSSYSAEAHHASYLVTATGVCTSFLWSGNNSRPTWVWGANASGTTCVYNPACWSVNYATSAGSATSASCSNSTAYYTNAVCYYRCVSGTGSCCCSYPWCLKNLCSFPVILSPTIAQKTGLRNTACPGHISEYFGTIIPAHCAICIHCYSTYFTCNPICLAGTRVY